MFLVVQKKCLTRVVARTVAAIFVCFAIGAVEPAFAQKKALSRANKAIKKGEYGHAEAIYRELLAKNALETKARLGLSFSLAKQRKFKESFDHAARVVAVQPLSARARALLGSALLNSGEFSPAIEEFRTALSLNSDEALAIAGLAMVSFYGARYPEALIGLRRAVQLDSNEPDYIFNLALAAARSERYKEAADSYERFLAIAPRTDAERRNRIRGLIAFLRYLGHQGSLYAPGGSSTTQVSFELQDSRPVVEIRLNGEKDTLRFVLDTGSGMSVVSEETARRLKIRPIARGGLATAVGGGGKFDIVYGFLSSLEIGEAKIDRVPVYIRKFYTSGKHVDGYIGLSVLARYLTTLDYSSRTLTLNRQRLESQARTDRGQKDEPSNDVIVRTTSSGFLSAEVSLEGVDKPVNFIIDTGASISVVAQHLASDVDLSAYTQDVRLRIFGAAGIADNVELLLLPKVTLGPHSRERIAAAVLDLSPINETTGYLQSGILGGNFLRQYRITFDFLRGMLTLEPVLASKPALERSIGTISNDIP